MRKIVLILIVLCVSQLAFSQKNNEETPQPELKLENRTWVVNSPTISESQILTIKVKGLNHLIKGKYTSFTDSTLVVDNTTIAFNDIESIRVTKEGGLGLGVGMLVSGVTLSGLGLVVVAPIGQSLDSFDDLIAGVVGGTIVAIGTVVSLFSTAVLSSSTHTYNMEKWKLYVSYPEDRKKIK
ncbi:MAG: hypothetical protein IT222_00300 [Crocinitomix sp.]|nr:hypothetical protein [Crocinitomix sp.]